MPHDVSMSLYTTAAELQSDLQSAPQWTARSCARYYASYIASRLRRHRSSPFILVLLRVCKTQTDNQRHDLLGSMHNSSAQQWRWVNFYHSLTMRRMLLKCDFNNFNNFNWRCYKKIRTTNSGIFHWDNLVSILPDLSYSDHNTSVQTMCWV